MCCGWTSLLCTSKPKRETREQRAKRLQGLKDSYLARDRAYVAAQQNAQQSSEIEMCGAVNEPKASSTSTKGKSEMPESKSKHQSKTTKSNHQSKNSSKSRHKTKDKHQPCTEHPTQPSRHKSKKSAKGKEPVRG